MTTTNLLAALSNASNAANAAYLSNNYPAMVAAYVQLVEVANLATQNNHYFLGQEASEMAQDLRLNF
jgi:allantoicase